MGLLDIFKPKKKENDCCNVEIIEVKEENNCCQSETTEAEQAK